MVVITHYQRLLDYIVPDVVHVLAKGRIVKTGGKELALELEAKGYAQYVGRGGVSHERRSPTPVKTPAEQALADAYAGARARLPGKGAVAALRENAFRSFEARGLPHRRVEEWKYTDLRALMREAKPLAAPPDAAAQARGQGCRQDSRRRRVPPARVRRRRVRAGTVRSGAPEPGLTIGSLAEALAKGDPLVAAPCRQDVRDRRRGAWRSTPR